MVLTEAGHRRAAALALRLKDTGVTAIFTTTAVRTQETAEPTARALGITPKVVEGLFRRITSEHARDRVLIVNHSLNLPALLRALGYRDPPVIHPTPMQQVTTMLTPTMTQPASTSSVPRPTMCRAGSRLRPRTSL